MKIYTPLHLLYLTFVVICLTSCLGDTPFEEQRRKDEQTIKNYVAEQKLSGTFVSSGSGLFYTVLQAGVGNVAGINGVTETKYDLFLLNGVKIASSPSYTFKPGVGSFMGGLSEGAALMTAGEKATFVVPSFLAFGAQSINVGGVTVPANSVLKLDVSMLAIRTDEQQTTLETGRVRQYFIQNKLTSRDSLNTFVAITQANPSGEKLQLGISYTISYVLKRLDGSVVETNTSFPYVHTGRDVIKGFHTGLNMMRVGEKGIIGVISDNAYGAVGSQGKIGPYTPLLFEIVDIKM